MVSRKDSDGEAGRIGVYVMKHVESVGCFQFGVTSENRMRFRRERNRVTLRKNRALQVFDLRGDGSFVCYLLNRFISDQSCVLWLGNATFSIVDNDNHVEFVIVEGLHVYHFEEP
ncbi:hypothetical protein R6Q59_006467 [Mikania micrantha]